MNKIENILLELVGKRKTDKELKNLDKEDLSEEVLELGEYLNLKKEILDTADRVVKQGRSKFSGEDEEWAYVNEVRNKTQKVLEDSKRSPEFVKSYESYKKDRTLQLSVEKSKKELERLRELEKESNRVSTKNDMTNYVKL
jgi:hypothetical protein